MSREVTEPLPPRVPISQSDSCARPRGDGVRDKSRPRGDCYQGPICPQGGADAPASLSHPVPRHRRDHCCRPHCTPPTPRCTGSPPTPLLFSCVINQGAIHVRRANAALGMFQFSTSCSSHGSQKAAPQPQPAGSRPPLSPRETTAMEGVIGRSVPSPSPLSSPRGRRRSSPGKCSWPGLERHHRGPEPSRDVPGKTAGGGL